MMNMMMIGEGKNIEKIYEKQSKKKNITKKKVLSSTHKANCIWVWEKAHTRHHKHMI
jgi:hypothetical protein